MLLVCTCHVSADGRNVRPDSLLVILFSMGTGSDWYDEWMELGGWNNFKFLDAFRLLDGIDLRQRMMQWQERRVQPNLLRNGKKFGGDASAGKIHCEEAGNSPDAVRKALNK